MPEHTHQPTPTPRERPGARTERSEAAWEAATRAREAWGGTTWPDRIAAGIVALALVLLGSAMPAAWPPPVWPTKVVQVVVPLVVDALPLEGIHTVEFTAPANTTVIRAEIDGHVQSVNIPGGQPGRVVFSFPGSHAHRYAAIVLQTPEGIRRVETRW